MERENLIKIYSRLTCQEIEHSAMAGTNAVDLPVAHHNAVPEQGSTLIRRAERMQDAEIGHKNRLPFWERVKAHLSA